MTVELGVLKKYSWWQYWPCYVGGAIVPTFGILLGRWLPSHFAFGAGGFIAWFFVGLVFGRRHPPKYGIPVWLVAILAGLGAGLGAGVMAYYLPLK